MGCSKGTIDGTSIKGIRQLIQELRMYVYVFGRAYMPKPKGGVRPLGMPEFRDRLTQVVLRTLLEYVKSLKHLNKNNVVEVVMIASHRTVVPLCRVCHPIGVMEKNTQVI